MRALLLFVIGLAFGAAGGFIGAGGMGPSSHDHAGHDDAGHDHSDLLMWDGPPPDLSLAILDDPAGVNLQVIAAGFEMTPAAVNTEPVQGQGHAHVYVNGVKVTRLYSDWVHLGTVVSGDVIRVTLNANDHASWAGPEGPIAAEITVP